MARTYRKNRLKYKSKHVENRSVKVPDGSVLYATSGCRHHGDCDYCTNNRTFKNKRRELLVE